MDKTHDVRRAALIVGVLLAACDTESSRRPPTSPGSTGTASPAVVRLELQGPGTMYTGQETQYTVTAHRSDGSSVDATATVAWRSSGFPAMTMTAPGRFLPTGKGETTIFASQGRIGTAKSGIIVVPEGTYRLRGIVRDSGVGVEAHVRAESQPSGPMETNAFSGSGRYVLYGVGGETRITVTKSGYNEERRTQVITEHTDLDFDLVLSRSRADITGAYTLVLTAAGNCGALPEDIRSRTFGASITQSGPNLTVTLSGPQFGIQGGQTFNRFAGFLEADRAFFYLSSGDPYYYYYYYSTPMIFEFLGQGRYFAPDGTATTSVSRDLLEGPLSGGMGAWSGPPWRATTRCSSATHRFVLSR